jgi:hypothetical protein
VFASGQFRLRNLGSRQSEREALEFLYPSDSRWRTGYALCERRFRTESCTGGSCGCRAAEISRAIRGLQEEGTCWCTLNHVA